MENLRTDWIKKFDTIVLGAGYGGLIAATILAKRGQKVAIIEKTHRVGGRVGCANWHDYWLDFGHRDDDDYEDNWIMNSQVGQYYRKAAEAAGVGELPLVAMYPAAIIHELDSNKTVEFSPDDPDATLNFASTMAGATPEQVAKLKGKLAYLAGEDPAKWLPVSFGEWLAKEFPDPAEEPVHRAMLWMAGLIFALPPEKFSVGRFIQLIRDPITVSKIDDRQVGGMQGLPEAYRRKYQAYGGEIFYGQIIDEIILEGSEVKGVVARDEASVVTVFKADAVVYSNPVWQIFKTISEEHFDPAVVAHCWEVEKAYRGDSICINIGLSRQPTIRETGKLDDYPGCHCFAEDWMGANLWVFNSISSPKTAPEGKHLLWAGWFTPGEGSRWEGPFKTFEEGRKRIDIIYMKMREYYSDLDEVTEWVNYQWHKGYWGSAANFWPLPRCPMTVDTIKGLYFAGSTVECDGLFQEISANSGLQVANLIQAA